MKRELFCYNQYIPEEEKIKLRLDREKDMFLHSHEFVELVYVIEGEADHIVENKVYRIREGDFFLLDSGVTHAFAAGGCGHIYMQLHFPPAVSQRTAYRQQPVYRAFVPPVFQRFYRRCKKVRLRAIPAGQQRHSQRYHYGYGTGIPGEAAGISARIKVVSRHASRKIVSPMQR